MMYVVWYLQVVGRHKDRQDLENLAAPIKTLFSFGA
jgi:hypothetical protein